jgi:putative endonuclease
MSFPYPDVIPARAGARFRGTTLPRMQHKIPAVYILASRRNGTLYIGVTSNLVQRIWQHRNDVAEGFSKRYAVHLLVFYEIHGSMPDAILREKQLKKWNRAWKLRLIESVNPQWRDLWLEIIGG